ncbi:DUF4870 domain-containing protein [Asanoa siamensis]|nr:DUF4870 domain-containing protein [Asanoa siamensis]
MTEPPRPPGEGPSDPNYPPNPYQPTSGQPTSGGGAYPPAGGYPPPGGGYPPQGGGYPPGGSYPPGPGYGAPAGFANSEEKTWALIAHFGGALLSFISTGTLSWVAPLVALLVKGNTSPAVRAHAVAALNFQITWAVVAVIGWATACLAIGFIIFPIAMLIQIIFGIIAGVKANEGQLYRYPLSVNVIK